MDEPKNSFRTLQQAWHPIARSGSVGQDPTSRDLLGETVVLFRNRTGVVALRDLCIHRGTPLSLGCVTADGTIQCAYHGWEYDETGACTRIPSRPLGSTIPRSARVPAYKTMEAHGLVWCAMGPVDEHPPAWPYEGLDEAGFREVALPEEAWNTSAGRAIDNFLDISHLPFVHGGIIGPVEAEPVPRYDVQETPYGFYFERYADEPMTLHAGGSGKTTHWEYYLHSPFTSHIRKSASTGEVTIITMAASPTSETTSTIFFCLARNYDMRPEADEKQFAHHNRVSAQDRRIVERQMPEQIPTSLREELHVMGADAASVVYRRLLAKWGVTAEALP